MCLLRNIDHRPLEANEYFLLLNIWQSWRPELSTVSLFSRGLELFHCFVGLIGSKTKGTYSSCLLSCLRLNGFLKTRSNIVRGARMLFSTVTEDKFSSLMIIWKWMKYVSMPPMIRRRNRKAHIGISILQMNDNRKKGHIPSI